MDEVHDVRDLALKLRRADPFALSPPLNKSNFRVASMLIHHNIRLLIPLLESLLVTERIWVHNQVVPGRLRVYGHQFHLFNTIVVVLPCFPGEECRPVGKQLPLSVVLSLRSDNMQAVPFLPHSPLWRVWA
jgi:hypothetical protein